MACINISGRLYPPESLWNVSESDDSSEWLSMLDGPINVASNGNLLLGGVNSSASTRTIFKGEIPGIVCMFNPEQMLEKWDLSKNLGMLISYFVIFVIGVLGNVTAMLGMIGDRKSRNATTLFLVSLSAADLLLLLVCAPLEASQYFVIQWDESGIICKTAKYAEVLSAVASVLNLTAVSLERFIVIVFPIRSRSVCTMSNCRRAVIVVWIVSLLLTAPILLTKGTNPWTFTDGEQSITINYCEDKGDGRIFAIYQAVILLLAPGLVMIICYTYVIRELWISTRNMRVLTNTESHHEGRQQERRWRSAPSRWLYPKRKTANFEAEQPQPPQSVGSSQTVLVVGQAGSSHPTVAAQAPDPCLLPCHGPCSACNQASPRQSYSSTNGQLQQHHGRLSNLPESESIHREAQSMISRKPTALSLRQETLIRTRPTIRRPGNHQARAEDARNARKQVIKMLILVIVLFLICWGSRLSMEISIKIGLSTFSQEIYFLRIAINLLPYVHSCLNPFIYSLMSKNFRRSMWRRIHCCCCFWTGCCPRRRCFCNATSSSSSTAAGLNGRDTTEEQSRCSRCRQFSSHYNLQDLSVASGPSLNIVPDTGERSGSRMRGLANRLTRPNAPSGGGASPLLLTRSRSVNNRTIYSTAVIPGCAEHSESDCCL